MKAWLALSLLLACGQPFPRDPAGTTERVRASRVLRVGLTEHERQVFRDAHGAPAGSEVKLAQRTNSTGACTTWS